MVNLNDSGDFMKIVSPPINPAEGNPVPSTDGSDNGRYKRAVTIARDIALTADEYLTACPDRREGLRYVITTAMDNFLGFLLDAFQGDVVSPSPEEMFEGGIGSLDETRFQQLTDSAVPLVIIRELMIRGVRFDQHRSPNFDKFCERYSEFFS